MIDEKQMQEAAIKCADDKNPCHYAVEAMDMETACRVSFEEGVNWFKRNLWHDACEEPNEDKAIITEYEECAGINYEIGSNDGVYDWRENVKEMNIKRWCYISDLIPKGGEK